MRMQNGGLECTDRIAAVLYKELSLSTALLTPNDKGLGKSKPFFPNTWHMPRISAGIFPPDKMNKQQLPLFSIKSTDLKYSTWNSWSSFLSNIESISTSDVPKL